MLRRRKEPELSIYDVETEIEKRYGAKIIYEKIPEGWKSPQQVIDYARNFKQIYLKSGAILTEGERLQLEGSRNEIKKLEDEIKDAEKKRDTEKLAYLNSFYTMSKTAGQRLADETRPIVRKIDNILKKSEKLQTYTTILSRIATALFVGTATRILRSDTDTEIDVGPFHMRASDLDILAGLLGYIASGWPIERYREWKEGKLMEKLATEKRRIYAEAEFDIIKELKRYIPAAVEIKPDLTRLYKDHQRFKRKYK